MHRQRNTLALTLLAAMAGFPGCALPETAEPVSAATRFTGAWKVDWCEQGRTSPDCGGFVVYLVEEGGRICGSHYGVDARQNRMDEGEMPSIVGIVQGGAAVVEIRSARNHSLIRARMDPVPVGIRWTTIALVEEGVNGEPALIPDRDVLVASDDAASGGILSQVRESCRRPSRR